MQGISVQPAGEGWMVQAQSLAGPLVFRSASRAEDAAWRIARALADNGAWAQIEVAARDGLRLSRFLCPPGEAVGSVSKLPPFAAIAA